MLLTMLIREHIQNWDYYKRVILVCADFRFDAVLGTLQIVTNYEGKHNEAYISSLYVNENSRRRGVASDLMNYAEDWCRKNSINTVYLHWVDSNPTDNIYEWYLRLGYQEQLIEDDMSILLVKKLD